MTSIFTRYLRDQNHPMSALGHKRTFCGAIAMSALPPKADTDRRLSRASRGLSELPCIPPSLFRFIPCRQCLKVRYKPKPFLGI